VGFGLPLAGADVESILVVDEEIDVSRGAATVGVVSGNRVRERLAEAVQFGNVVRRLSQREGSSVLQGIVAVDCETGAGRSRVAKR
jgi:hypothetical protein